MVRDLASSHGFARDVRIEQQKTLLKRMPEELLLRKCAYLSKSAPRLQRGFF